MSTIHQPSSEAFAYFDRLLLMADGNIVYQGLANMTPEYFAKMGFTFNRLSNPSDVFMRILSISYPKEKADDQKL